MGRLSLRLNAMVVIFFTKPIHNPAKSMKLVAIFEIKIMCVFIHRVSA
jgi:hypothetical protein